MQRIQGSYSICQQLSDWFYQQLDEQLNTISTSLERLIMAIIALIVGTLIIAMYLPILQLSNIYNESQIL